jgi:transcriptional regulator with XRE-family HTH domain
MLLKRLREERKLSQEQVAFATGLSISGLSKIERGVNNPTWTSVWDIASALGIEMGELVAAVEEAQA